MPKKQKDDATELLRDILIVELGMAEISRESIRQIARCDNNRVAKVLRLLKARKKTKGLAGSRKGIVKNRKVR